VGIKLAMVVIGMALVLGLLFLVTVVIVTIVPADLLTKRQRIYQRGYFQDGYAIGFNVFDSVEDSLFQSQTIDHNEISACHEGNLGGGRLEVMGICTKRHEDRHRRIIPQDTGKNLSHNTAQHSCRDNH
jgi:hypothetical protein